MTGELLSQIDEKFREPAIARLTHGGQMLRATEAVFKDRKAHFEAALRVPEARSFVRLQAEAHGVLRQLEIEPDPFHKQTVVFTPSPGSQDSLASFSRHSFTMWLQPHL